MADIDNPPEATLPAKRKSDLGCHEQKNKTLKLQPVGSNSSPTEGKLPPNDEEKIDTEVHEDGKEGYEEVEEGEDDEGEDNSDDDDDDDEEGDDDEEELSGEPVVDRKGKGILRDDKGKGKLIEEEEDSDEDDDSSDGENQSDDDSDLSDDPMAEVDLDNILPSRTRRRVVQPSLNISKGVANEGDDSDDDDA